LGEPRRKDSGERVRSYLHPHFCYIGTPANSQKARGAEGGKKRKREVRTSRAPTLLFGRKLVGEIQNVREMSNMQKLCGLGIRGGESVKKEARHLAFARTGAPEKEGILEKLQRRAGIWGNEVGSE